MRSREEGVTLLDNEKKEGVARGKWIPAVLWNTLRMGQLQF